MFPPLDPRITESILEIVQDRRIVGILGIGGLLWTSTWVFSSLSSALNIIFRVEKDRSLLRQGSKRLQGSSPLNNSDQHHDDGDDQQDVNESANRVATDQSQQPQN
jgi:hypothetical protein